jgi:hypothetical protein
LTPTTTSDSNTLFVDALYDAGIITSKVFSFFLSDDSDTDSYFTVGGYNETYVDDNSAYNTTWNDLIATKYWSVDL